MANDNVHPGSTSATPQLASELDALHIRVRRMESLLRGAESILNSIRFDGELSYTPADESNTETHRRAFRMIEFLGEQFEQWRKDEFEFDAPSEDIWNLLERAKDGRLVRYGKLIPEPA